MSKPIQIFVTHLTKVILCKELSTSCITLSINACLRKEVKISLKKPSNTQVLDVTVTTDM